MCDIEYFGNITRSKEILGCTDDMACNFNMEATEENDSCVYPEKGFSCDNECYEKIDCKGVCGGASKKDKCGICDGDGSNCKNKNNNIIILGFIFLFIVIGVIRYCRK